MKRKGLLLLVSTIFFGGTAICGSQLHGALRWNTQALAALLFGTALICLVSVKFRIYRRTATTLRRHASALASALRSGMLD